MPGITVIGDSRMATRARPTSLPAEARSVARVLRLLNSPVLATEALLEGLSQVPSSPQLVSIKQNLMETVELIQENHEAFPAKEAEHRLSLAMEWAVQKAFLDTPTSSLSDGAASLLSSDSSVIGKDGSSSEVDVPAGPQSDLTLATMTRTTALVSDSSTAGGSSEEEDASLQQETMDSLDRSQAMRKLWALALESLHLQVASRTTRIWGRKKIYEIYHLTGPARSDVSMEDLRKAFEKEFRTVFHGGGEDQSGCRTYALMRNSYFYLQINIGKWYDLQDENNRGLSGEKKKKKGNEFVAMVAPGESLLALTASRAPSRSRFTMYVLQALDAALVQTKVTDASPERVGDWSGTEPHELLESARAAQAGQAVGRFAKLASEDLADPLVEMHQVSTASLLDRTNEQQRLATGAQHGRAVAQVAATVERQMDGKLVAANATGLLVDPSAARKSSRKRARDVELGGVGDCPRLQRFCWKWTGETTAAAACWRDEDDKKTELPQNLFKCAVTLEGTNVMEGLREMVEAGWAKAPLPEFVRDAPTLGSTTVTVDHGAFGTTDSFAAV